MCICVSLTTQFRAVYRTLPVEVANELAYVPDQMILDFLFIKVGVAWAWMGHRDAEARAFAKSMFPWMSKGRNDRGGD